MREARTQRPSRPALRQTRAWLLLLLLAGGLAYGGATPWTNFEIRDGHLAIPTRIGGVEGYSIIDTGANFSVINQRFLEQHDLRFDVIGGVPVNGVHGSSNRRLLSDIPVHLMGVDINFRSAVEAPFKGQMLIGADFLGLMIFQFDYPNRRLRAITRDALDLKKLKNVDSRMDRVGRQPIVKVRLNDEVDVWMVIDTGNAGGVLLKRSVADRRDWFDRFAVTPITSMGLTATGNAELFRMPLLGIGPYDVRNVRVIVPAKGERIKMFRTQGTASGKRSRIQGLLGFDVLKNFLVTIDYTSGAMHIEIPETLDKPPEPAE